MSWIPGCLDGATRAELAANDWGVRRFDRIDVEHDEGTERGTGDDEPDNGDEFGAVGPYDGDGSGRHRAP